MNKQTHIKDMIETKLREQKQKELPTFLKRRRQSTHREDFVTKERAMDKAQRRIKRFAVRHGFTDAYSKPYVDVPYHPKLSREIIQKLDLAQRLAQLGKKAQSKAIYDELIARFKLDEVN